MSGLPGGGGSSALPGAYGLTLPTLVGNPWLGGTDPAWPTWDVAAVVTDADRPPQHVGPGSALLHAQPAGWAVVDRAAARTRLHLPATPPEAAWAHPLLGSTAALVADWGGRVVFHGGVLLDGRGRAWGLLGDREDGKSTTLAWLAARGTTILADDLVVTDGRSVLRGPRCVDLRAGAAERFRIGDDVGVVGTRQRWRVTLPPAPPAAPLAGFVSLSWGEDTVLRPLPVPQRAPALAAHRGFLVGQQHPLVWLELLSRPVLGFARPQRWDALEDAMTRLLDALAEA